MGVPSLSSLSLCGFVKNFTESLNELFTVLHFPAGLSTAFGRFPGPFSNIGVVNKKRGHLAVKTTKRLMLLYSGFSRPRSRISAMVMPRAA
ncbi:hypothetical protein, partial [Parafannyhessea umbonata]|uniref:hypothetical protein n=1 Tax=Parafannyhessea umbonata TaxID=604330 RepID=UPI0026EAA4E4